MEKKKKKEETVGMGEDIEPLDVSEAIQKLNLLESNELCKGIFGITDVDDIPSSQLYFQTPCDSCGNTLYDNDINYTSNDGLSFNHKATWSKLPNKLTHNNPFDYYPRGRVEINNGKAVIYCNPNIATDELKDWAIGKYHLNAHNGIKSVKLFADGSSHYRCYLDKD